MMKRMQIHHLRLCLAALGMIIGLSACNYEDGPVISLRGKGARMQFTRPLTYYENDGIDSTAALNPRFEDSIPGFEGLFVFKWEVNNETHNITSSENRFVSEIMGYYVVEGFDDFERISIMVLPGKTWPGNMQWTITRLTHRKLWLEGPGGRLLRFEE